MTYCQNVSLHGYGEWWKIQYFASLAVLRPPSATGFYFLEHSKQEEINTGAIPLGWGHDITTAMSHDTRFVGGACVFIFGSVDTHKSRDESERRGRSGSLSECRLLSGGSLDSCRGERTPCWSGWTWEELPVLLSCFPFNSRRLCPLDARTLSRFGPQGLVSWSKMGRWCWGWSTCLKIP